MSGILSWYMYPCCYPHNIDLDTLFDATQTCFGFTSELVTIIEVKRLSLACVGVLTSAAT